MHLPRLLFPGLIFSLLFLSIPSRAQSPDLYIDSTYDRFKDQTKVRLLVPITRDKDLTVSLLALGLHHGRKPETAPPVVMIGMYFFTNKGRISPQNRELLALADGKSLDFGEAVRIQVDGLKDDEKSASYGVIAPYADVRTFAEATKAEMRFFGLEGTLPANAQQALDAFLRRLRP